MFYSPFASTHSYSFLWRSGRVVECTGLENRHGFTPIVGSNPTSSAIYKARLLAGFLLLVFRI